MGREDGGIKDTRRAGEVVAKHYSFSVRVRVNRGGRSARQGKVEGGGEEERQGTGEEHACARDRVRSKQVEAGGTGRTPVSAMHLVHSCSLRRCAPTVRAEEAASRTTLERERERASEAKEEKEEASSATRHTTLDRRTQTAFPAVTFARTSPLPPPPPLFLILSPARGWQSSFLPSLSSLLCLSLSFLSYVSLPPRSRNRQREERGIAQHPTNASLSLSLSFPPCSAMR